MRRNLISSLICCVLTLAFVGCVDDGLPDLGDVTGVVTLDGEPLAYAQVFFNPESGAGRTAMAKTDESGHYKLLYNRSSSGAQLGPQSVTISKLAFDPQNENDSGREVLPARYLKPGTLTAEVKAGENVINFELTSEK